MLLRFGVENFRSIKEYQELSFVASAYKDAGVELFKPEGFKGRVLPAIGLYGANASGKSTVLRALRFFVSGILTSYNPQKTGKIGRVPFALDPAYKNIPSRFDCDLLLNGTRFHYGFSISDDRVEEEWLYTFSTKGKRITRQTWFYRNANENVPFVFGKELRGLKKTLEELTRKDSLFLSVAAANNHKQLQRIHEYFLTRFHFRDAEFSPTESAIAKYLKEPINKDRTLEFLRLADIGILSADVKEKKNKKDLKPFMNELQELFKKHISQDVVLDDDEDGALELTITHRSASTKGVPFKLNQESKGTVALLGILGPVFESLNSGALLVVDELNTNLHPLVSKQLIALFSSRKTNRNCGQLIFATHDTNLLCGSNLRRDQIWFTEKDPEGATHLYPLSDIKTRPTDNIERGYLEGRFGAIPFFGSNLI